MDFLRQIALCYQRIGTTNVTYNHIIDDLVTGKVATYKEAANKYYNGNEQSMYKAADRMKKEFYYDALECDSYHNEGQRIVMEVRVKAASVNKLLYMGFREVGIETALQTYKAAKKYHIFDVAAEMASIISQHFGQHLGDSSSCTHWYTEYEFANQQRHINNKAKYMYAQITSSLRHNKGRCQQERNKLKEVIDQLSLYKNDAEGYLYWNYYYELKICYHELKGEYQKMRECASKGYNYFASLAIDHKSAKLAMISFVIEGYNLVRNYKRASGFTDLVKKLNDAGANKDLALLRLSKSYINLCEEEKALELLNSIKGSLTDVAEKIDLYKSYCTGTHPDPPQKEDPHGMDIAYKIATLYCDILSGETNRYTHNYILKYIRRHDISVTREGIMLKILSIMRHRDYDAKKFKRYHYLREVLSKSTSSLTEIEIMQYETMLDKIDAHYQN